MASEAIGSERRCAPGLSGPRSWLSTVAPSKEEMVQRQAAAWVVVKERILSLAAGLGLRRSCKAGLKRPMPLGRLSHEPGVEDNTPPNKVATQAFMYVTPSQPHTGISRGASQQRLPGGQMRLLSMQPSLT